jgi:hypothetical protein
MNLAENFGPRRPFAVRRMWPNGPLRQCSATERGGWLRNQQGIYVGQYVCSACREPSFGVYEPDWVCGSCRKARRAKPSQPTPAKSISEEGAA